MLKNIKLLILSIFPAPYRVAVFAGLSQCFDVKVFFEVVHNENRNPKWFDSFSDLDCGLLCERNSKREFESELLKLKSYDAVLIYDYSTPTAMKLMLQCILHNVKFIINCDGAFINKHLIKDRIKKFFISRATACLASGDFAKSYFKYYGATDDVVFMHNFSSLSNSDILNSPVSEIVRCDYRIQLGLSFERVVVSVGQFIQRKGYDILLDAWRQLDSSCGLVIIGGGDKKDEYVEYIADNNMRNVTLVDYKDKADIFKYYKSADIFVLPTREDVWGLVVNEAMACGLPVITTDRCIAGLELVVNGENGYIVPVGSVDELAKKLVTLLSDGSARAAMGMRNIEKIRRYTIENIVSGHVDVISSVVG